MRFLRCFPCALFCALLPVASAQTLQSFLLAVDAHREGNAIRGAVQVQVSPNALKVVAAEPFSAVEAQERTQLLPDGSHQKVTLAPHRVFRDSFGRTRLEQPLIATDAASPVLVEINDPGSGVYYLLDPVRKVAYKVRYAPPKAPGLGEREPTLPLPKVRPFLVTPGGPIGNGTARGGASRSWNRWARGPCRAWRRKASGRRSPCR